jgi:hypothetical protein
MRTETYRAYNLTRNEVLSSKVTVADAELDPLKALVLLVDGLGVHSEAGLWLKPLSGAPEIPRLFSFDIVYLDHALRVVETTAVVPGVDIPPYRNEVASALILPEGTLSSTQTEPGDQLSIDVRQESNEEESEPRTDPDAAQLSQSADVLFASSVEPGGLSPQRRARDEAIALEIVKTSESPLEPFPNPLIYMPAINGSAAQNSAPFEQQGLKAPEAHNSGPQPIGSQEELPIPVPLWALRSAIGALVDSAEFRFESSDAPLDLAALSAALDQLAASPVQEQQVQSADQTPPAATPAEQTVEHPKEPSEPPPAAPPTSPMAPEFTWTQSRPWQMSSPTTAVPRKNGKPRAKKPNAATQVPAQETERIPLPDPPPAAAAALPPAVAKPAPTAPHPASPIKARAKAALPETRQKEASDAMVWADERFSLATRFQRWIDADFVQAFGPLDRRRSSRIRSPQMVAYYWSGGFPKAHHIADISASGICLLLHPDDRWTPDTILRMTLQRTDKEEGQAGHSVTVLAKVVRIGLEGVGHQFVMEESFNRHFRDILPFAGTDRQALERFLLNLH